MQHTLVVVVEDTPFALNRVASLLRRRAFSVASLSFVRGCAPGISRIEVVVESDAAGADRLTAYLSRLIDVRRVENTQKE